MKRVLFIVSNLIIGGVEKVSDIVPDEANIGYAMAIPLSEGAKAWAEKIFKFIAQRQSRHFELDAERTDQYDIHKVIRRLEVIYDGR